MKIKEKFADHPLLFSAKTKKLRERTTRLKNLLNVVRISRDSKEQTTMMINHSLTTNFKKIFARGFSGFKQGGRKT